MRFSIWIVLAFSWSAACTRFDTGGIPLSSDANPGDDTGVMDAPPGCNNECFNNDTQYCDENGMAVVCPLGCSDTGGAHCQVIVPSNGANDGHLMGVTGDLIVNDGDTVTISTGPYEPPNLDPAPAAGTIQGAVSRGPVVDGVDDALGLGFYELEDPLSVLAVKSLDVKANGTLRIVGSRPLIILSEGDVTITGLIDIGGGGGIDGTLGQYAGPGGGRGAINSRVAEGCAAGGNSPGDKTGGGGGGLGAQGASGGDQDVNKPGGTEAAIDNCPGENLVPLVGGSGGGEGHPTADDGGNGGGGGGALQITSKTRIVFMSGGEIWAGGGGGRAPDGSDGGGGGGGSGGAILLEAPEIRAAGAILTANGGGGGGGRNGAQSGEKGRNDTMQAAGGAGGSIQGDAQPGAGGDDGTGGDGDGTGGGGGGVGIIRINAPADFLNITNAIISPAHTRGDPAAQ